MYKILLLCGTILMLSLSAQAQDERPKFDVFAGYSFVHFKANIPNTSTSAALSANNNGGAGAVTFYPSKWLGFVADFGVYKASTVTVSIPGASASVSVDQTNYSYLFGPRIRFGSRRVTPFVQALFGGAHNGVLTINYAPACAPLAAPCTASNASNAFAMAAEGGIDIKMARHFSLRGQGGYFMTRFPENNITETENNARVSVGIVIH